MRSLIFLSATILALSVSACSSSNDGDPTIDSASVTDSPVPANSDGSYTVDLTVNFSDVVDVDSYNFDSTAASLHLSGQFAATPSGSLTLEVTLPIGTQSGTLDFDISVTDVDNVTSNDFAGTVILDQ